MSEYPDQINIEDYKSAAGAAKKVHKYLQHYADVSGYSKSSVILKSPNEYKRDCWAVIWAEGPSEWAYSLTGGESITGAAMPQYGRGKAEIKGLSNHNHMDIECGNKYSLEFYNL